MINIMIKKTVILVVAILAGASVSAQAKYGADEQKCKENLSMFREYYKNKNYTDAYIPWMWSFNNCPESSQNIYKNGPRIIKEKMKADKENKLAYIDTLMMVFDQRTEYFGKEGYVLGLKGFELIGIDKTRSEEALGYLKKSLDLEGNNASVQAVYGYMKAMVNLEKSGNKTKTDVLAAYAEVSEIIDFNIVNESKATKNFVKYSEKIEDLFTPYANCNDLINFLSYKFDNLGKDPINTLKRIIKLLDNKDCTDSDLFFNASSKLYELEPSASAADQMSKMSIVKGKSSDAIAFAKKAIEAEEDVNTKAKYYLALADAYRSSGSYSSSRGAVYSALELRSNWGEAYINLGNIYVAGAKSCGNDFETQTVYWVAVDAFKQALSDSETKDRASKSINTYSKYFPTKESCFFNGIIADSKHTVGCWINQPTKARTSD
jgi:tetratricopeptide (TPR) repeat protein